MSNPSVQLGLDPLPALSVVIPTYNRKESLRITLEALERQSYPRDRFEVVVVSDGSTDGTGALLAEYAERVAFRLRPVLQTNGGPSRARNRGIQEATGDIVVFIDDDVEPVPDFLANHAAHHRDDPNIAVIGPMSPDPALRRKEPVWIAWEHAMLEKQYSAFRSGEWSGAGPNHFYSGNASIRRAHLLAVEGFDETFKRQEDVELAYRLQRERSIHFVFDAQAGVIHRPLRTFESWLKVPYAYGRLDAVRARRGDVHWGIVRYSYVGRSLPTRLLADIILPLPPLSAPVRGLLRTGAILARLLHADRPAFHALSVLYNVHYLEGVRDEIGYADLRRLCRVNDPTAASFVPVTSCGTSERSHP
jgi:glycosyltransferase involved in cell wall biosynthesis